MHDAKRSQRRGGVALATDGVVGSATRDLELEAELRAAIAADALVLEYQPVVGPGRPGAAPPRRWCAGRTRSAGVIPPGEFLPVAQRGGLLRELDGWVLRTAARARPPGWPEHGGRPRRRGGQPRGAAAGRRRSSAPTVTDIVESRRACPGTGSCSSSSRPASSRCPPHALAAMDGLAERGVRFAVDDFGTGYSSLARLKELPAQIVKVDRAFVTRRSPTDPADFAVARAVVDMAHAMGRNDGGRGRRDGRAVPRAARHRRRRLPGLAVLPAAAARAGCARCSRPVADRRSDD